MEFHNTSPYPALAYKIEDARGVLSEVVVARTTFLLERRAPAKDDPAPRRTHVAAPLDLQPEIVVSDVYFGEMNRSSVRYESDLAQQKPRCDVIVVASAWSPTGEPVPRVDVGISIDRETPLPGIDVSGNLLSYRLAVHGPRRFVRGEAQEGVTCEGPSEDGWRVTAPEPFVEQPIRYEHAFGGEIKIYAEDPGAARVEDDHRLSEQARAKHPEGEKAPIAHTACAHNPVGTGFLERWYEEATQPTEWPAPSVVSPEADLTVGEWRALVTGQKKPGDSAALTPQGFGVITKSWEPRIALAGTFDDAWLESKWPLMPDDFQMAYWNGAHARMCCTRLFGGDTVTLENLAPPETAVLEQGHTVIRFDLPDLSLAACLYAPWVDGGWVRMTTDTVIIDLGKGTVTLVWRLVLPAEMNVREAVLAVPEIGPPPEPHPPEKE